MGEKKTILPIVSKATYKGRISCFPLTKWGAIMPRKTKEELSKTQVRISEETAREYQRRSVEAHYKKKALREELLQGIKAQEILNAFKKGIDKADMRAIELFCKLTGQMPAEKLEATQTVTIKDDWRKIADDLGIKPEG